MPSKTHAKAPNQLRIIAGSLRGRKVPFCPTEGLRPTLNRIRETAFNWLQPYLLDASCLDLFAGSGIFGFESISRGAQEAVFLEPHDQAFRQLEDNAERLGIADQCHCMNIAFFPQFDLQHPPFDVVFLDPPFHTTLIDEALQWLVEYQLLHADSVIYIEFARNQEINMPDCLQFFKHKKGKQLEYALLDCQ